MSTIASPREPSTPIGRRMNSSSQAAGSPTPSRTSIDNPSSARPGSPSIGSAAAAILAAAGPAGAAGAASSSKRSNRAALREYYHLKKPPSHPQGSSPGSVGSGSGTATPTNLESADGADLDFSTADGVSQLQNHAAALLPASELDGPDFDAAAYVRRAVATQGAAALLGTHARALAETRALDAERKALVYDNYSKLIAATATIRRLRDTMDGGGGEAAATGAAAAAVLDPALARVYSLADEIRAGWKGRGSGAGEEEKGEEAEQRRRRRRTKQLALEVLEVPDRMRRLVAEDKMDEARRLWEMPRRLLLVWKEKGLGGPDVQACLDEGDALLRGDDSDDSSEDDESK